MDIQHNISNLKKELGKAKLVVVTKTQPKKQIMEVIEAGATMIGENRLQEIEKKYDNQLFTFLKNHQVELHYIGQLQSNKIPKLVKYCQVIQSVTSLRYTKKISEEASKGKKNIGIFLQLNLTGEEQKAGFKINHIEGEDSVPRLKGSLNTADQTHLQDVIDTIQSLPNITLIGFMCMGKQGDLEASRVAFATCKHLTDEFQLSGTSMGMSQDYHIALEEGATHVRVGSKIFD